MAVHDFRHIINGNIIPTFAYSDQPYIVKADDGAWVCATTTGTGVEGAPGECVIISRSIDFGITWTEPARLDDDADHAYAVLVKAPYGRIYCFYNHNTDDVKREDLHGKRCDMGGHFVFKYSDDSGRTWSSERYEIPVREFEVDRNNRIFAGGKPYRFFWNVGKPFIFEDALYLPLIKFDFHPEEIINHSEGVFLTSDNLAWERYPSLICWQTLPDGGKGLAAPEGGGRISEEHSIVPLSDGSFFCVYRTTDGRAAYSYSRDKGHTWDKPKYMPFKNPRAANFVWKCENGRYLYWFHNHGLCGYTDRNPAWIACGTEADGTDGRIIEWGQPEVLLYDDSDMTLISYPDMIEDDGRLFITETQKDIARVHEIPRDFIDKLMSGGTGTSDGSENLLLDTGPGLFTMPPLPPFSMKDAHSTCFAKIDLRAGMTFDIVCGRRDSMLFDNRDGTGKGILIESSDGIVLVSVCDGRTRNTWDSSPYKLKMNSLNHIGIIIDGGPKIISFIMNGALCDGGGLKPFGWCRFASQMTELNGGGEALAGDSVKRLRIYGRALMTCEIIGNFRSLPDDHS